ncbi:MAG TPA: serine hydrolase domain-containing protein [Chitinophaga sp.]|nr:serine hydrolase domain-containing protein [Chitinophaga sp.]
MKRLLTFIIFSLFSYNTFAQESLYGSLDSVLSQDKPRAFNGVVLISKNGREIYKRRQGFSDLEKKTPVRWNDQFMIGSVSKQFTAVLVLREVQAGRIQLDRTIGDYLPDFPENWKDSVTVRQLLKHISGITGWKKPLAATPGSRFAYSNLNYNILGQIVAKVSGKSYEGLVTALFRECNMSETMTPEAYKKSRRKSLVKGYVEQERDKLTEEDRILDMMDLPVMSVPAAGLISTAGDLMKWNYHLHNGKLLADSLYRMMSVEPVLRSHRWGDVKYGLGIQVDSLDNIAELSMNGYVPGFITSNIYYPATKTYIVILENIALDPSDMNRVYYFHDAVRKLIRNTLTK